MTQPKVSWIPEVPRERILQLAETIKPVARMAKVKSSSVWRGQTLCIREWVHPKGKWHRWPEGELYYLKPVDPFTISYTWALVPTTQATDLKPLADIRMYHTYGWYGCFKPLVSEVLAQIPEEYLDRVVAFEIIEQPEDASDLNRESEATNAGYHVSKVRLYCRA